MATTARFDTKKNKLIIEMDFDPKKPLSEYHESKSGKTLIAGKSGKSVIENSPRADLGFIATLYIKKAKEAKEKTKDKKPEKGGKAGKTTDKAKPKVRSPMAYAEEEE